MPEARLHIPPVPFAAVERLERELGCSHALAQVLVRRGLAEADAARGWMAAADRHDASAFGGLAEGAAAILRHVEAGSRIVVHGDYDVDGVCSTAIVVRALRGLGADVGWFLPSRGEDGYGLNRTTVERLAGEGCALLVTVDCGITAVEEVAAARALGVDVVVTDHHTPRADGALPDAPIVHPGVGGYPCPELCATGVAYLLARALLEAAGGDPAEADGDLDLVALATVADCVPLIGENRRLVREGLRALAGTRRPGLRALMAVARCDPGAVDARSCGFRLAPRINAAGRLSRADAGLELLLTEDGERARQIAEELDHANAERRHVEQRILFEAEGMLARHGEAPAHVLAGDGWHPGVIGIVASRLAERHGRPVVMIALPGDDPRGDAEGVGSGRSIPSFDLLGGLDAAAAHLVRHGGHRAAAGCTIRRDQVEAFRAAFVAHAGAVLSEEDFVPLERVDAVVSGAELGVDLAEELEALAPFGQGNPDVSLLVPAARLVDPRAMGEGKHVRFTVESGGARARAVAFGVPRLPDGAADGSFDATFGLELNEWNGAVEPRLVLRRLVPCRPAPVELVPAFAGDGHLGEVWAEAAHDPAAASIAAYCPESGQNPAIEDHRPRERDGGRPGGVAAEGSAEHEPSDPGLWAHPAQESGPLRDRRGRGVAGSLAALVGTGEPVLVIAADAYARKRGLDGRLGGFALTSWAALERDPGIAAGHEHLAILDPPVEPRHEALLQALSQRVRTHLCWGEPELAFAGHVHERDLDLRAPLRAVYAGVRDRGAGALAELPPVLAGRCLRVLRELDLVVVDGDAVRVPPPRGRADLERSPSFRAYEQRLQEGRRWLSRATTSRAA